jgi:hypothetical protein
MGWHVGMHNCGSLADEGRVRSGTKIIKVLINMVDIERGKNEIVNKKILSKPLVT